MFTILHYSLLLSQRAWLRLVMNASQTLSLDLCDIEVMDVKNPKSKLETEDGLSTQRAEIQDLSDLPLLTSALPPLFLGKYSTLCFLLLGFSTFHHSSPKY